MEYNGREGIFYYSNEYRRGGGVICHYGAMQLWEGLYIPQVTQITEIRVSKNIKIEI
jgi:hypothetical protein